MSTNNPADRASTDGELALTTSADSSIGDVLRRSKGLTDEQIEQIVLYQRANNLRFGESAVALNFANNDEVLWALSQQFHYPYAIKGERELSEELRAAIDPFGEQSEVFRDLRSQLLTDFFTADKPKAALAIVSPDSGDGKTFFSANLAVVLSQLGAKTLLVDANLRTPRQHEVFKIRNDVGLSSILMGREESHVIHQITDLPSLFVMPAGTVPPNPLELVQRPAFGLLINDLLNKFDHIVVDTPGATNGSDSRVIAAKCGAALVIGRRHRTKMDGLEKLGFGLARSGIRLAGMVINEH